MPMLFSLTIGAAITSGLLVPVGTLPGLKISAMISR
jgi:hypothetical protein